jgi:hypothetical protein
MLQSQPRTFNVRHTRQIKHDAIYDTVELATFRRKIDVSGIEVSWLPQNKTRRGERRARVGLD